MGPTLYKREPAVSEFNRTFNFKQKEVEENSKPTTMNTKLIVLFLVVAVLATAVMSNPPKKIPKCGKNEVWSKCGGKCQATCKVPKPICTKVCSGGCQCKAGLLRNKKGQCVQPCDC